MDEPVFLDTSFLIAFVNEEDEHHEEAREEMRKFERPVISNAVFSETMNTMFSRGQHRKAVEFGKYLRKSQVNIINLPEPVLENSFEKFKENKISFTDCSIVASMEMLGAYKLATFDQDFSKFEMKLIPKRGEKP
jgi:predicted nucleic acid-binding protein